MNNSILNKIYHTTGILGLFLGVTLNAQVNGNDTLCSSVVSDVQWKQSTVIDYMSCNSFPWTGVSDLPHDSTFTLFPSAEQPYGYVTISTVPDASVIRSDDGVRFYKSTFLVDSLATITSCRFRAFVDDDMAVYLNGTLIAQESSGTPSNYKNEPHDLQMYNFGPHQNGYEGGDVFDFVTLMPTNAFIKEGENELTLAIRNKKNDLGGFSFRMDYGYVLNPEWVSINELENKLSNVEVYPNPTTDELNITWPDNENALAQVLIYDAKGSVLYQNTETSLPHVLNLASFPQGIYNLTISNGRNTLSKKIIRK